MYDEMVFFVDKCKNIENKGYINKNIRTQISKSSKYTRNKI